MPSRSWNTAAIRDMLTAAFSDEGLTDLCFDYFPAVYEDFGSGMSKRQKIQRLLEYCARHEQLDRLVSLVSDLNPAQYARFRAELRSTAAERGVAIGGQDTPPYADREGLERALRMARRSLAILEEQAAGFGALHIPAHLQIELEEQRRKVADMERRLK